MEVHFEKVLSVCNWLVGNSATYHSVHHQCISASSGILEQSG